MINLIQLEMRMREYESRHGVRPTLVKVSPEMYEDILKEVVFPPLAESDPLNMTILGAKFERNPNLAYGSWELTHMM